MKTVTTKIKAADRKGMTSEEIMDALRMVNPGVQVTAAIKLSGRIKSITITEEETEVPSWALDLS